MIYRQNVLQLSSFYRYAIILAISVRESRMGFSSFVGVIRRFHYNRRVLASRPVRAGRSAAERREQQLWLRSENRSSRVVSAFSRDPTAGAGGRGRPVAYGDDRRGPGRGSALVLSGFGRRRGPRSDRRSWACPAEGQAASAPVVRQSVVGRGYSPSDRALAR